MRMMPEPPSLKDAVAFVYALSLGLRSPISNGEMVVIYATGNLGLKKTGLSI